MPCIVESEKSDTNVDQKDSQLELKSTSLKMDMKASQENGVDNLNGENGHVDSEDTATQTNNVNNDKVENGTVIDTEEASKEEEDSQKPEGI